ncbi:MAG: hypothetical protein R3B45_16390 [Bdellovibrionota bacterium]
MITQILMVGLLCVFSTTSLAGEIRTLYVNDQKMQPIRLRMGKATVLRFPEKPKKVVIGNQNYYSVEFIDYDLTLQPQGEVETNLFVYTPFHTYGFLLKVCNHCSYDDLARIKWKSNQQPTVKVKRTSIPGFKGIGRSFKVGSQVSVEVLRSIVDEKRDLRLFDLEIKNIYQGAIDLHSAQITATRHNKALAKQGFVIEKEHLAVKEVSKARLFLPKKETRGFTVEFLMEKEKGKTIISHQYLK